MYNGTYNPIIEAYPLFSQCSFVVVVAKSHLRPRTSLIFSPPRQPKSQAENVFVQPVEFALSIMPVVEIHF